MFYQVYYLLKVSKLVWPQDDIEKTVSKLEERIQNLEEGSVMDALVLPLHGSLPPEMQVTLFLLALHFLKITYTNVVSDTTNLFNHSNVELNLKLQFKHGFFSHEFIENSSQE